MSFRHLRPILERLAYGCYFFLLVSSIGFIWLGWIIGMETGNYAAMCIALGGLAIARWMHVHGHAHWHFHQCQESLNTLNSPHSEHEKHVAGEISTLFDRLEAEENVWVRGEIRRQIESKFTVAPTLREHFAEALTRHPEL